MDWLAVLLTIVAFGTLFYLISYFSAPASKLKFPADLPGPSFREYLPGGPANKLYSDSRALTTVLVKLGEKYGLTYQISLGFERTIVTSNADDLLQILGKRDEFVRPESFLHVSRTVAPNGILSLNNDDHKKLRTHLRDKFNISFLEAYHKPLTEAFGELRELLVDKLKTESVTDFLAIIETTTFRVIISAAFGINMPYDMRQQLAKSVDNLNVLSMKHIMMYPLHKRLAPFGAQRKLIQEQNKVFSFFEKMILERLEQRQTESITTDRNMDLMDHLIDFYGDDLVSLKSQVFNVVVAGAHTTAQTLSWCIYNLCADHQLRDRLQTEVDIVSSTYTSDQCVSLEDIKSRLPVTTSVWKETLRCNPPIPIVLRLSAKDITLRGSKTNVPKGTPVLLNLHHAHLTSKYWRDGQAFNAERWCDQNGNVAKPKYAPNGSYLPFGAGPRGCVGSFFAEYVGVLMLAEIYRRFNFELACEAEEIVSLFDFVQSIGYSNKKSGAMDIGIPVKVKSRG